MPAAHVEIDPLTGSGQNLFLLLAERGAARLAHRSGGPGVASSNLAAPTIFNFILIACPEQPMAGHMSPGP